MAAKQPNNVKPLRWFHVRLRTLLLGVTLLAVLLAVFASFVRPFWQQRALISAITAAGGTVETRGGPKWLRSILGEENCQEITLVNLADINPGEDLLAGIATLPNLEILVLGGTELEDDALHSVPNCDSLQAVILDSTLISDEAIATLRNDHPDVYIARSDRKTVNDWPTTIFGGLAGFRLEPARSPSTSPPHVVGRLPAVYFEEVVSLESDCEPAVDTKLLPTMHELRELMLDIEFPGLSSRELEGIAKCRKLERLEFDGGHFRGSVTGTAALNELVNLQSFSLRNIDVTDDEIHELTSLTQLRSLDLSSTNVQDPASWPRFPLESLTLEDTFIEDDDLSALARYDGLEELSLTLTEITDAGLPSLLPLKNLRAIKLIGTRITEPSYGTLCRFPNLQQVALGSAPQREKPSKFWTDVGDLRDQWVPPFGPVLKERYFAQDVPYTDFDPATFKPSPEESDTARANVKQKLGAASFQTESPFEAMHLDLLLGAAGIKELDLSDSLTCDDDIPFIVSMPDLEILNLADTWVTDAGIRQLAACPKLRALNLAGTAVSHAGLTELAKMPSLEELVLPRQTIHGESFRALCQFPKLRGVELGVETRSARGRVAADYDVDDMTALAELLQLIFHNMDVDGNNSISRAEYVANGEWELVTYAVYEDYPLTFAELIWEFADFVFLTPEAEAWLEQNYGKPPE